MVMDSSLGMMEGLTMGIGKMVSCMVWEYKNGPTDDNMKENFTVVKQKGLEYMIIQTEDNIKETGKMENNTAKAP